MSKILKVKARQVFDSRGNPTVEAEVYIKNNSASAICPSGASTGTFEAFEKRDKNNKRYLGKSVLNAVNLVNTKISKKLKGQSIHNQERIDALLINLLKFLITTKQIRIASEKLFARSGLIINSWILRLLFACAPPLIMFING